LGGIDVADAEVDGFVEGFEGVVLLFIGQEAAAAADAEDGDAGAGFAEEAGGELAGSAAWPVAATREAMAADSRNWRRLTVILDLMLTERGAG